MENNKKLLNWLYFNVLSVAAFLFAGSFLWPKDDEFYAPGPGEGFFFLFFMLPIILFSWLYNFYVIAQHYKNKALYLYLLIIVSGWYAGFYANSYPYKKYEESGAPIYRGALNKGVQSESLS
ncbi:MAG: hypothetical protein HRU20_25330 [Pseudomonadales bacterium]|nr:hypothetical protein [Pseudomonadales bacterium]